jgi:DNA-binding CsgD family transcriptional regulator
MVNRAPSDPLASAVLNSLSAHIAILDAEGVILETNEAWRRFANAHNTGPEIDAVGDNYLTICEQAKGGDADDAHQVAAGIRRVIAGRVREFVYDYPCHSPEGKHWYYMRAIRMIGDDPLRVVVSHEDITALKLTEEALRRSREEIAEREKSLEEANIALKVLLKQREADKADLERKVLANVKGLVFPYLEKLQTARLKPRERTLVEIAETHLKDIISPFLQQMANADLVLTPQEMQVAALIRDGKSSKEIASILFVSEATVNFHRKNLREKFGLKNKRVNLRAYLLSMA